MNNSNKKILVKPSTLASSSNMLIGYSFALLMLTVLTLLLVFSFNLPSNLLHLGFTDRIILIGLFVPVSALYIFIIYNIRMFNKILKKDYEWFERKFWRDFYKKNKPLFKFIYPYDSCEGQDYVSLHFFYPKMTFIPDIEVLIQKKLFEKLGKILTSGTKPQVEYQKNGPGILITNESKQKIGNEDLKVIKFLEHLHKSQNDRVQKSSILLEKWMNDDITVEEYYRKSMEY